MVEIASMLMMVTNAPVKETSVAVIVNVIYMLTVMVTMAREYAILILIPPKLKEA